MDPDGFRWNQMDSDGFRSLQMDSDGLRWIQMGSDGFRWNQMELDGVRWIQSEKRNNELPTLRPLRCIFVPTLYQHYHYHYLLLGSSPNEPDLGTTWHHMERSDGTDAPAKCMQVNTGRANA